MQKFTKICETNYVYFFVLYMKHKFIGARIKQYIKFLKIKIQKSPLYGRSLMILLFLALIVKEIVVYFAYENLNPWKSCISFLASDISLLVVAHLLVTVNSWIKQRKFRIINDIIIFLILILFCVDIFTIYFFQSRVSIIDAFAYGSNWWVWYTKFAVLWIIAFIVLMMAVFLIVQYSNINVKQAWKKMTLIFSLCVLGYSIFYSVITMFGIDTDYVENILSLNLQTIVQSDQTEEIKNAEVVYEDYIKTEQWNWKDINVILVFAESLSAIDSARLWWYNNLPNFDKIQKDWITFNNFITNGTTSDTAHIATLLWVIPLINMWANWTPYSGYKLIMPTLPEYFNSQWYATTFISAAWLKFLDQRSFLSWAWFQKIIWEEAFLDSDTYAFDSAPDKDLYKRALQEVQSQTGKYFIWLQTISFHKPYNAPYWKTEELALQYSDEALYEFYTWLKDLWFFDSGILVIVWDHRMMNPAREGEYEILWPNWYTKSVATVVWTWIKSEVINSNIVQHTDFFNSIKKLVWSWELQVDKMYNNIFASSATRDWAITNSEYYENNRYTISYSDSDMFLFKNLSKLKEKDDKLYNYMSAYMSFEFGWDKKDEEWVTIIWHRWAINDSPENTLQSFLSAKEQWAKGIEFDISYTKDGQNIVIHGWEMYASNCTKKYVKDYTFDWIQDNCTIINWEKYRTLQDMLELIDWLFDYYFVEIKVYDESKAEEQTLGAIQTVKDLWMQDKVIFISYDDTARKILNNQDDIIFGWDTFDVNDISFIWENNSKYFLAPYDLLTSDIVEEAANLWKRVVTYTVNDTWSFQDMLNLWVNIIMTDKIVDMQEYFIDELKKG